MHCMFFSPPCSQSSNSTGLFQKTRLQKALHLGPLQIPSFPTQLGSPEACFFLPFLSKHSTSAFCWALPSLFLSCTPHLSLWSTCSAAAPLEHSHSATSLKKLLQGTTHRHHLSWFPSGFLTQERHKLRENDNLHHSNSSKLTQMHNMLSSQWSKRQEAQCKTVSTWATQQKWGSCNSS